MLFKRKMQQIQYTCYNKEVERTGKKFEGNLTLSIVVQPGGKANPVKITESSVKSPEMEACVIEDVKSWEWPDVPSPTPYMGSIGFKPAW